MEQAEHAAAEALAAAQNAPDQAVADADRAIAAAEEAVAEATDAALVEETDAMSEAEVEAADNSQQARQFHNAITQKNTLMTCVIRVFVLLDCITLRTPPQWLPAPDAP